ncbi:magnesium transporter [Alkalilimnicola ehrlichii]|uniref:Magnesium transporter MgtE n=1 Tax=Alkalilimnicola ehrlichii TaxID=351052 RepID=A0A3E0WYG0_9GAMM|nr:magnesium transporter [Alkalilimnicola ehrlichii]RFA30490.1 magnesium transporter [Alkalilimnicola ehrlichii]RFA38040.1 magnesium transporter [Alkalilimnicola ehrlichii]
MEQNQEALLLRELVQREAWEELAEQYDALHVQDIADALGDLNTALIVRAFNELPRERWPEVFAYFEPPVQYDLLRQVSDQDGRFLLAGLLPDDRTALLEELPQEGVEALLKLLTPEDLKQALKLLGYPENSAGRLMNTRFVAVHPEWTLAQALEHVRRVGEHGETVNTLYVTDHSGRLEGTVSLKRLVLGEPQALVESLVSGPAVSVLASEERTEAARMIQHYDITALPVVDRSGIMLGIVTVDDVMDVLEEENTEDFQKIGGTGAFNLSLRDARPSLLYRKRVGWLVLLVFMNIFGGASIAYFEDTIEAVIALVFFLPLIVDSGGNAGSQSATLMVRALATGDVQARDWLKLWGKELGVATALGVTMGLAVWGLGLWRGGPEVGTVVALSMVAVVIFGSMIGMLLPFLLTRLNFDPATASAPLITSIADICGILIYFSIATALLTIPVG